MLPGSAVIDASSHLIHVTTVRLSTLYKAGAALRRVNHWPGEGLSRCPGQGARAGERFTLFSPKSQEVPDWK